MLPGQLAQFLFIFAKKYNMKITGYIVGAALSVFCMAANAQVTKKVDTAVTKAAHAVDTAVTKAANKTAEVASNTKSLIVDSKYKGKAGPHGETIYIDHESKYYYISATGRKIYIAKDSLRDVKK